VGDDKRLVFDSSSYRQFIPRRYNDYNFDCNRCFDVVGNAYIPMQEPFKKILNVVVVIAVVLWLLQGFGLLGPLPQTPLFNR